MTIGIFGGSFNPVHCGHIALADAIADKALVDRVWLTLSPQNPLKSNTDMLPDHVRLEMLKLAVADHPNLRASDIELSLPRPSYTINTLTELSKRYPQHDFRLIIGADNMLIFDKWRDHDTILSHFKPIVYPRPGYSCPNVVEGLPLFDVSSTEIREKIKNGIPVNNLLPSAVLNYIITNNLYTK